MRFYLDSILFHMTAFVCVQIISGKLDLLGVENKHGYIGIGSSGRELFYWLFKSEDGNGRAPLVIWIEGGPGCGSEHAIFRINGPYTVLENLSLSLNPYSWQKVADMLYIDQPYGTSLSFLDGGEELIPDTEEAIASDLYGFLLGFMEEYPRYKARGLYLTGQSYAGHYVPALAAHILALNNPSIFVRGVMLGDPSTDPGTKYSSMSQYAWGRGLLTHFQFFTSTLAGDLCLRLVRLQWFSAAKYMCDMTMLIIAGIGYDKFNILDVTEKSATRDLLYEDFVKSSEFREEVGLKEGEKWRECSSVVKQRLSVDYYTDLSWGFNKILEGKIPLIFYMGMDDLLCNWMGVLRMVYNLQWEGVPNIQREIWRPWVVEGAIKAMFKKYSYLALFKVFNAGHLAAMDQKHLAFDLLLFMLNY